MAFRTFTYLFSNITPVTMVFVKISTPTVSAAVVRVSVNVWRPFLRVYIIHFSFLDLFTSLLSSTPECSMKEEIDEWMDNQLDE